MLLYHISTNSILLTSINGPKIYNKSGDSWIIALQCGTKLNLRTEFTIWKPRRYQLIPFQNPFVTCITNLFEGCCDLFSLSLNNAIHTTYDKKSDVTKTNEF